MKGKRIKGIFAMAILVTLFVPSLVSKAVTNEKIDSNTIDHIEDDNRYEFKLKSEGINSYDGVDDEVSGRESTGRGEARILSSGSRVDYSRYKMARILKYVNGNVYNKFDLVTNIYQDSDMSKVYTYINQGYCEDAPVITDNGSSAKILINGYEGWINKDKSKAEYDMVEVTVDKVVNPSRYYVSDGILYHFISSNMVDGDLGYSIEIGKAPSYLKVGVRYLSYDGRYFYDGTNIADGLVNIIDDLKAGNKYNAINRNSEYFSYFQYLPFRSKTSYTENEINRFINNNTITDSKLRGTGSALITAQNTYGVNALLTLGVAINESGGGTSQIAREKNNIFGINAEDNNPGSSANSFNSVADCINEFAKNYISRGYGDPADWRFYGGFLGDKKFGASVKYASDPYWGEKAARYAFLTDYYLAGKNINNLADVDYYQLGIYTIENQVINKDNSLLYKVNNHLREYSSYVGTTFIITNIDGTTLSNGQAYEIHPDRNTPVGDGGVNNKFHGNYVWADKGYISTNGVKLINEVKDIRPFVEILGGQDRFETAVALSKSKFTKADTVVIVNESAIIDGVTASALATGVNGPILLGGRSGLNNTIKEEIKRLGAKKALLVGGTTSLGQGVKSDLNAIGITDITQLGGSTRYGTALEVAKYIDKNLYDVDKVFLVYGSAEPDALSAGAISGQNKAPIILTDKNSIPSDVKSWLSSESLTDGYVIGGTSVITTNVVNQLNEVTKNNITNNRFGGANRYETNALIIERFYGQVLNSIYVAKGQVLIDALAAGPIAALDNSPIVLSDGALVQKQISVLTNKKATRIVQAGLGVNAGGVETIRNIVTRY